MYLAMVVIAVVDSECTEVSEIAMTELNTVHVALVVHINNDPIFVGTCSIDFKLISRFLSVTSNRL